MSEKELFPNSPEVFGDKYYELLLEQYKISTHMADSISERRSRMNTFFLSVNSFLLTALGIFTKIEFGADLGLWWLYVASTGGGVFAITWFLLIRNYKKLNTGKFAVIHELEKKLPASPYTKEWNMIQSGSIHKKYQKLTNIESFVPLIFMGLYAALCIGTVLISK